MLDKNNLPKNPHALLTALTALRATGAIDDQTWEAIEEAAGEYGVACEEAEELFGKDLNEAIRAWRQQP